MSELLKYTLITSLVVTGLGILGVMVLGELPDSTMIIDPYFDNAVAFCAYSFMVLCVAGFFCIFIKPITKTIYRYIFWFFYFYKIITFI